MLRFLLLIAALCLPAAAIAQGWWHAPSGVGIAELPAGLGVGRETDGRGDGSDVTVQLGTGDEPVTLYIYRSAFPNPVLWFERTRHAMNMSVGSGSESAAPRAFTLGGGAAPNGLREAVALPSGARARSTAVAIAQFGEWMIKLRITSTTLDRAGIEAKLDGLLAAIRFPGPAPSPHPLVLPASCPDENRMRGARRAQSPEATAEALLALAAANAEARGRSGLAAEPAAWCRDASALPAQFISLYRRRDGGGWAALIGDSGLAVSANRVDMAGARAATFAINPSMTGLAALYDDLPAPDAAIDAALPIVVGRQAASVSVGSGGAERR